MSTIKDRINSRIAVLKAELAELETAAKVIDRLASNGDVYWAGQEGKPQISHVDTKEEEGKPGRQSEVEQVGDDLSGKTMMDCARIILSEASGPMHYQDVYRIATERGYSSGRAKGGNASSFWALLKRDKTGTFVPAGRGKFKLNIQKGATAH